MKRLLFAALLASAPASAQTVPPPFTTQGAVPTIAQWSNAWAGKLDAPLTATTTPTSGYTVGELLASDGTKLAKTYIYSNNATSWLQFNDGRGAISFETFGGGNHNSVLFQPVIRAVGLYDYYNGGGSAFRVYNNRTDASNGEWGMLDWQTTPNVLSIGTYANGTGAFRGLQIWANGANRLDYGVTLAGWWNVGSSGMLPQTPHAMSLGAHNFAWGSMFSDVFVGEGTQPTITGAGGTCATSTKVGGATVGTVVLSGICATGNTIAWTGMPAMTNGYACDAQDRTTRTALFVESASTTTGFTLTTGAVSSVAGDVLQWKCMGF